jgi:hypothetical protein
LLLLGYLSCSRGLVFGWFVRVVAVVESVIFFVFSVFDFAVDVGKEVFEGFVIFFFLLDFIMIVLILPGKIRWSVWLLSEVNVSKSATKSARSSTEPSSSRHTSHSHAASHGWLSSSELISHIGHALSHAHHASVHATHIRHGCAELVGLIHASHHACSWHLKASPHARVGCELIGLAHAIADGALVLLSHVGHVLHDLVQLADWVRRLGPSLGLGRVLLDRLLLLHAHVLLRL